MTRKLIAITIAAAFAAPAFAETGVGISSIDNVANVYGRAGVPAVKVSGVVVYKRSDVNLAGRNAAPTGAGKTVVSNVRSVNDGGGLEHDRNLRRAARKDTGQRSRRSPTSYLLVRMQGGDVRPVRRSFGSTSTSGPRP